jgi:hypothetical protein
MDVGREPSTAGHLVGPVDASLFHREQPRSGLGRRMRVVVRVFCHVCTAAAATASMICW